MKKLFSLFVPLMALFLTLAPQTARAQLNEYFYITGGNINVTFTGSPGTDLYYSTDKSSWTQITSTQILNASSTTYYLKGTNNDPNGSNGFSKDEDNYVSFQLKTTGVDYTVGGNIMSLVNASDFSTNYSTIPADYCFYALFKGSAFVVDKRNSTARIDASALVCPATTLTKACYKSMFETTGVGITGLPTFSATTMAEECYARMFYGDRFFGNISSSTSSSPTQSSIDYGKYPSITESQLLTLLNNSHLLTAVNLATRCYSYMFYGCTSMPYNLVLPATVMAPYCYEYMFASGAFLETYNGSAKYSQTLGLNNITALAEGCFSHMFYGSTPTSANGPYPALPTAGVALADKCYEYMFASTKLATPPTLPATTLAPYCYSHMFDGCTSLTSIPALPAIYLENYCYESMFSGCNNIKTANSATTGKTTPYILPAEELVEGCYYGMFNRTANPTSATYLSIKIMATSLVDRNKADIRYCMREMFKVGGAYTNHNTYLFVFFKKWSETAENTNSNPTYNWFVGSYQYSGKDYYFYIDTELTQTKASSYSSTPVTKLPAQADIETVSPTYLTFKANDDGTWTEGGSYSDDLFRVVDVTNGFPKTVPAHPYKEGYTFKGWYDAQTGGNKVEEAAILATTSASTFWAQYEAAAPATHIVTIDRNITDYGTVSMESVSDVADGATISVNDDEITIGETTVTAIPTTSDGDYTYTFSAWKNGATTLTGSSNTVTDDMTITAHFSRTNTPYTLTWIVDGEEVTTAGITRGSVAWGSNINKPANPTKSFYTFAGWDANNDGVADEAATTMPKANTTYTALWAIANPLVLSDNENDEAYYTAYDALDGAENVNVRIERGINANTWSTICLPFDVNLEAEGNEGYEGKFYKYMGATGDYTGIDLHFTPTGYVDANMPYLFRSSEKVTQLDFANVTLQKREKNEISETGNVKFIGTIAPKTLTDDGVHTILGLYNNQIYYPNTSSGTYIRAFRGYFTVGASAGSVQPRVRIVVQDNNATPIEVIELSNGERETEVRKYVEDGVMVIEKNGVRYNVTGQEMK